MLGGREEVITIKGLNLGDMEIGVDTMESGGKLQSNCTQTNNFHNGVVSGESGSQRPIVRLEWNVSGGKLDQLFLTPEMRSWLLHLG